MLDRTRRAQGVAYGYPSQTRAESMGANLTV